ncbi:helix-turn-helix domain-containing protein [Lachnotalea glycerini]|uniref:XRE family transcriptional regulator n=1 Tax=Lachnotalea glycerini TaxID=1763509 RepID=A0A371JFH4_9FIRM|nr:helix-turn-helix transcriptional regulator [Lachnotalea glycerini]RDY31475.1 XRE family transcriptional regulator [Lachnotalea glycerini]
MQENDTLIRIKRILELNGWSIYRLAQRSHIPYSSLNNIFLRNTEPTLSTLRKICNGFGISLSEFFNDDIPTSCQDNSFSPEDIELLSLYHSLKSHEQDLLLVYASGLSKQLPK